MLKKIITILIIGTLLVLWSCKEEGVNEPPNNQSTEEKLANNLTVLSGASAVYQDTLLATADTIRSLNAMGQYIITQESVKEAYYVGSTVVEIYFNNGLRSSILLVPTDKDGHHLIRGGGTTSSLSKFDFKTKINSTKKIKNNKVLVLNPFSNEFTYRDYSKKLKLFKGGTENLEVTVIRDFDFGLDDIKNFSNYGFIILNTHGLTNGFEIRLAVKNPQNGKWTDNEVLEILQSNGNIPTKYFENGDLEIVTNLTHKIEPEIQILVTENYIRNSSINLTDAVLFGNHCYSGHTFDGPTANNMSEAWHSKGLATYYGYSSEHGIGRAVDDEFCRAMEDSLIVNLVQNNDITGVAHLSYNSIQQFYFSNWNWANNQKILSGELIIRPSRGDLIRRIYFYQYFDKNYKYGGCENKPTNMSATVVYPPSVIYPNGKSFPFEANDSTQQQIKDGKSIRILLTSSDKRRSIRLTTSNFSGLGTFSLGGNTSDWEAKLHTDNDWNTATSGKITIIEDKETCISGIFSFSTEPGFQVSNGKFLIKF